MPLAQPLSGVPSRIANGVRMKINRYQDARGFTLIELMVAVAIIAIGAAMAVPNFLAWHARYQLRQAATEIQSQLNVARVAAMNRNTVVNVNLALAAGKVQVAAADATGATVVPSTDMMSAVTGLNPAPVAVAFSPLGTRSGGGAGNQQIRILNNAGTTYTILVTPRGKVSWCPATTCP